MVPCIHRNGDILGYLVQYTGGGSTWTMSVPGIEATISNLMPSTVYSIQVAALNSKGTGVYSDPRNQLTLVEAPTITVAGSSVTSTSIPVTLTSAGSEAVSYEVGWTYDGGCAGISGGSASSGMDTSYTIEDLEEGITYSITVTATNAVSSEVSSAAIGKTSEAVPSGPPTSVSVTSTFITITVQWEPVDCIDRNGVITGYIVQYREVGRGPDTAIDTSLHISGLGVSTNYTLTVAAVNSAGTGDYSEPYTISTDAIVLSISVDSTTATSVSLSWTSASSGVTSYEVVWQLPGSDSISTATLSASITTYTIMGLKSSSIYAVTVNANTTSGRVTSTPVLVSTPMEATEATLSVGMVGGVVVAVVTVLSVTATVIVILILRNRRGRHSTGMKCRKDTTEGHGLSKISEEAAYVETSVLSNNMAYGAVKQTDATSDAEYEVMLTAPPPGPSH